MQHVKARGTPAWQRHQAAVSAGRYQTMLGGKVDEAVVDEAFADVIHRLADAAESQRRGDAAGRRGGGRSGTAFPDGRARDHHRTATDPASPTLRGPLDAMVDPAAE